MLNRQTVETAVRRVMKDVTIANSKEARQVIKHLLFQQFGVKPELLVVHEWESYARRMTIFLSPEQFESVDKKAGLFQLQEVLDQAELERARDEEERIVRRRRLILIPLMPVLIFLFGRLGGLW